MKKYIAEFIGTFALVFCGTGAIIIDQETAGAITLFTAASLGAPVSTTHTITGAIIGVGATKRLSAVRWGVTISLIWAWILTIPVSGALAALIYYLLKVIL